MKWQWQICLADLNPTIGSEQRGKRPVLVVGREDFSQLMPVITVLPITSRKPGRRIYPNEALLPAGSGGLDVDSLVLAHQIRTIDKKRLVTVLGEIDTEDHRHAIQEALTFHLDLGG